MRIRIIQGTNHIILVTIKRMEAFKMKHQLKKLTLEIASKIILGSAKTEANSSCFFIGYQPKLPENAKKLRKF